MVPKPAIATRSMSRLFSASVSSFVKPSRSNVGANPPKSSRDTSSVSIPDPKATSSPRQRRSDATSATSRPARIMASKMVPDPDTNTQSRTSSNALQRLDDLAHFLAGFGGVQDAVYPTRGERVHLRLRGAFGARDDGPSVSHLSPRGRGDTGDVGDDGLGHVQLDPFGGAFFFGATDLPDHHHGERLGVGLEGGETVDEIGPRHRVAADADARRLSDSLLAEFIERLVRERPGARNDSDRSPGQRDVTRGDPDVALARADDAWAVRTEQAPPRKVLDQAVVGDRLILSGNAFGDADDEIDPAFGRFNDRGRSELRRHHDERSGRAGRGDGILDRIEGRPAADVGAALTRCDAPHDLGAVV